MEDIRTIDTSQATGASREAFGAETVIDVEAEEITPDTDFHPGFSASRQPGQGRSHSRAPSLAERFNTETDFHGQSLAQLAVRSLWIVDYVRGLGHTEMADGDLESLVRCADDLESAIILMFQLAGGTRMELRQRYEALGRAIFAQAAGQAVPQDDGLVADIPLRS